MSLNRDSNGGLYDIREKRSHSVSDFRYGVVFFFGDKFLRQTNVAVLKVYLDDVLDERFQMITRQ
jgi:hypothetical protein